MDGLRDVQQEEAFFNGSPCLVFPPQHCRASNACHALRSDSETRFSLYIVDCFDSNGAFCYEPRFVTGDCANESYFKQVTHLINSSSYPSVLTLRRTSKKISIPRCSSHSACPNRERLAPSRRHLPQSPNWSSGISDLYCTFT